eukprot:c15069_g1_i2 orf=623-940(+)
MAPKALRPSFWYWDRLWEGPTQVGTVVIFGWMMSQPRHVVPYIRFYKSCGWDALVCHPRVLNIFFPRKGIFLALELLDELAKVGVYVQNYTASFYTHSYLTNSFQ